MPGSSVSNQPSASAPPDRDLLAAYSRGGDEAAFTALVQRHLGLVMGTASRRTRDPHLAEEVAQTTFGILARQAASLSRVESLAAWLHRVALVQSIRVLRQLARHRRKLELAMHHAQLHRDPADPYEEALPWLDEALEELPDSDRHLLVLRYYEQLSFVEISQHLGRSEAALRQQAGRALDRLSVRLRRRGVAVPAATLTTWLGASLAGPPAAAASCATLVARAALAAAPGVGGAALGLTTFLTMSTTKSIGLGAAAALVLASIPLGWQRVETIRLRDGNRTAAVPMSAAGTPREQPSDARPARRRPDRAASATGPPKPPAPPPAKPEATGEEMSAPMKEMLQGFFRRRAEEEADRTALALGMLPEQAALYRDFIEKRYRERADADSDEVQAGFRREDRAQREEFIGSLLGREGLEHYRAVQQRRDEAATEKASGAALHAVAHTIDLTESQKQQLFQTFGAAARDDAAAGRASSFSLSFGYGMDPGPRLADDESVLSSILTPEQLALWQRHGPPDPEMARKALELVAPMVAGNPDVWKQMSESAEPTVPSPSDQ